MPVKSPVRVEFEPSGDRQRLAVRIVRAGRSPLIASLHRALIAVGIVVASYQVRPGEEELLERIVLERQDGEKVEGPLERETEAIVLRAIAAQAVELPLAPFWPRP